MMAWGMVGAQSLCCALGKAFLYLSHTAQQKSADVGYFLSSPTAELRGKLHRVLLRFLARVIQDQLAAGPLKPAPHAALCGLVSKAGLPGQDKGLVLKGFSSSP